MAAPPSAARSLYRPVVSCLALLALVGCASAPPPPVDGASDAAKQTSPAAPAAPAPQGALSRQEVDSVLEQGPPWLLQRIEVEEVIDKGQFVGWRLLDMPHDWQQLQRGDVVKKVNDKPLERPDEVWSAWMAIATASEIKVAFERDGQDQLLSIPISGDISGETKEKLESRPPPPTAKANGGVTSTVVIQGE
jgi:hypothetical protein